MYEVLVVIFFKTDVIDYLLFHSQISELGTRQICRDNVTMFSGHKVDGICHFTIFVVATPSKH